MKKKYIIQYFSLLLIIALLVTTCSKDEDPDKIRKEVVTYKLIEEISADTLESLVVWMQNMETRFALADNHRDIAVNIKRRFVMMGYPDTRLDSFLIDKTYQNINYQQWQYNVIATLEGSSHPDSVCIIGGHYDNILRSGDPFSVVPGANDNASGVAAAMELARVMKKNNYSPANTIEFIAFGAEEIGLLGSYAYAFRATQNQKKIKLMLNNDMIAYQSGGNRSDWRVNIMDYDNSRSLRSEAEQMCNKYTVLGFLNDNTHNRQSDSYPFFNYGYKALFFFSEYVDPAYHTIFDISENCNFEYRREIVKISCAVLVNNN